MFSAVSMISSSLPISDPLRAIIFLPINLHLLAKNLGLTEFSYDFLILSELESVILFTSSTIFSKSTDNPSTFIPKEDTEISHKFTEIFSEKYNVYLGYDVQSVSKSDSNTLHIVAKNKFSGHILELNSEQLLVAVGRVPNSDSLDIKKQV